MPALSLWLASTVLALATVFIPQEPEGKEAQDTLDDVVHVAGKLTFTSKASGGLGAFGDHALEWRGDVVSAELRTNDPRLNGDLLLTWNCDVFLPNYVKETSGAIATGSASIHLDDGAWEGVWHGLTYPQLAGGHHHIMLTGVGEYVGYSALLYLVVDQGELLVEGLLFPGDMPPVPERSAA